LQAHFTVSVAKPGTKLFVSNTQVAAAKAGAIKARGDALRDNPGPPTLATAEN
jgi:hypothetical protein